MGEELWDEKIAYLKTLPKEALLGDEPMFLALHAAYEDLDTLIELKEDIVIEMQDEIDQLRDDKLRLLQEVTELRRRVNHDP